MKIKKLFIPVALISLALGAVTVASSFHAEIEPVFATYTNHDETTYYQGISSTLTGDALLSALRSLNNRKRESTIGYGSLEPNYKYTDYDTETVSYDEKGQPFSDRYVAYYSGEVRNGMSGMNKEHVWPNSRGGNLVEKDIHMARPTLTSDNSGRGNSFFVEGSNSSSAGWDPKFANPSDITYRGDSARITFYCVVASDKLSLVDLTNDDTDNKTMGKLSDLIKWHLNYPILQREKNRNEGAEYLQGNRNPFIDHPEYVCRIWGNTNDTTRALCAADPYAATAPDSITLSASNLTISQYEKTQLTVASVSPSDASKSVIWTSSDSSIVSVDVDGNLEALKTGRVTITAKSVYKESVTATCNITVTEPQNSELTGITLSLAETTLGIAKFTQASYQLTPSFVYPFATVTYSVSDSSILSVDQTGKVTALAVGEADVIVTATQDINGATITKTDRKTVNVQAATYEEGSLTIRRTNFNDTSNPYGWYNWSVDGISGKAFIYGGQTSTMQFNSNQNAKVLLNTVELPGDVLSVNVKRSSSGQDKQWKLYVGSGVTSAKDSLDGSKTLVDTHSINTSGHTFTNTNAGMRYFMLEYGDSGATYLQEITVTYGKPVTPTPPDPDPDPTPVSVTGVTATTKNVTFEVGQTSQLGWTVSPSNADNKNVSFSLSATDIVSVSSTGLLTAQAEGTVVVTITTEDGGFTDTVNVTVNPQSIEPDPDVPAQSVVLNETSLNLALGQTFALQATINPSNATNKNVTWSTNNASVAQVSRNGVISARGQGTATITVTTVDGGYTATCVVNVTRNETPAAPAKGGCGGNIVTTSIVLSVISLFGIAIVIKKKHE